MYLEELAEKILSKEFIASSTKVKILVDGVKADVADAFWIADCCDFVIRSESLITELILSVNNMEALAQIAEVVMTAMDACERKAIVHNFNDIPF